MAKYKVVTNHNDKSDPELLAFSGDVNEKLTGNKNFNFPDTLLADFSAALDDFRTKYNASTGGDKVAITQKETAREVLLQLLSVLARYVNIQGEKDEAKLESSGFPLVSKKTPTKLEVPAWIKVIYTFIAGQLKVRLPKPSYKTSGILVAYIEASLANEDPSTWTIVVSTKHSLLLEGLKSRVLYVVCASYIGANDEKPVWSEKVTIAPA